MRKIFILPSAALALWITALCVSVVNADDKKEPPSALDSAEKEFLDKDNTPDPARDFQSDRPRRGPRDGMGPGRGGPPEGRGPDGEMSPGRGGPPEGRGPDGEMGPGRGGPPEGRGMGRGPRDGMGPGRGGPPEGRGPGGEMGPGAGPGKPGRGPGSGRGPWGDMRGMQENDPEMYALVNEDMECSRQTHDTLFRYQKATTTERESIRGELEKLLDKHFEVRQKRRKLEVQRMQDQIKKLQESIDERTKSKSEIIDRYLKRLLKERDPLEF